MTYRVAPEFENSLVPQLILQPLVENSLRHGLKNSESGIDIVIAAQRENGTLILRVADTGAGLGGDKAKADAIPHGLGLANIRQRMEQLYGDDQQLGIANLSVRHFARAFRQCTGVPPQKSC